MTTESISVVIPTYNRASLIARAVRSALGSCVEGDEILVMDDESADDTARRLEEFGDRIRYIRLSRGGAGRARNQGVQMARHPLVAFLDSDDEWVPGYLEAKRRLLQARPEILFCFSDFASCLESGKINHGGLSFWHSVPLEWDSVLGAGVPLSSLIGMPDGTPNCPVHVGGLYHHEMAANYVLTSTLVVRKNAGEALHFAEDLPTFEDWECYGRLARAGTAAYLNCETARQHGHSGPRLTDAGTIATSGARLAVLERIWGCDPGYLVEHGDEYRAVVTEQRQLRLRALLRSGRTHEARVLLKQTGPVPLGWKILAHIPSGLTGTAVRGGTALRRMMRAT